MTYETKSIALDLFNNWEYSKELQRIYNEDLLFYDNNNRLCIKCDNTKHKFVDMLGYDILKFFQDNKIDISTMTEDDFCDKFELK